MNINITIQCADCDNDLHTIVSAEKGEIRIQVEPCPRCVARKIMLAEQPWMRKKLLKEGWMAA